MNYLVTFGDCGLTSAELRKRIETLRRLRALCKITPDDARKNAISALGWASRTGQADILRELRMSFGLDANDARFRGCDALLVAAWYGYYAVVRELREGYALTAEDARSFDNYALRMAALNGHTETLRELSDGFGLSAEDARARSNEALISAVREGRVDILRDLRIQFGLTVADARARNNEPIRLAAVHGHVAILRELREGFGLGLEDARWQNNHALLWASHYGHVEILRELREGYGLTAEDARSKGNWALRLAVRNRSADAVQELWEGYGLRVHVSSESSLFGKISLICAGMSAASPSMRLQAEEVAARRRLALKGRAEFSEMVNRALDIKCETALVPGSCAICLCPLLQRSFASFGIEPGDVSCKISPRAAITISACGHAFHRSCVAVLADRPCPLCREPSALAHANALSLVPDVDSSVQSFVELLGVAIADRRRALARV